MQGFPYRPIRTAAVATIAILVVTAAPPATARVIAVGSPEYPTLAAAVAAIPGIRATLRPGEAIELVLPPGVTRVAAPVTIDAGHGGRADAPLILRGAADGSSRLSGAVTVRTRPARTGDAPGMDLPAGTLAIDLNGLGDVAPIDRRSPHVTTPTNSLQLFQGNRWFVPSRWPRDGMATGTASGTNRDGPVVTVPAAQAWGLRAEPALWAAGQWGPAWEFERVPLRAVTPTGFRLEPLRGVQPVRPTVRFRIENAIGALAPGSFAWQPARGIMLVVPDGTAEFEATVAPTLLKIVGTSHITIRGIGIERSGGDAVQIDRSRDITIEDCRVGQAGGNGIVVNGGANVIIRRTIVAGTGERGISLGGGSRATLTPAGHAFIDGVITDFGRLSPSYRPGATLWGVGSRVSGSVIAGGDHAGIVVGGNDHVITDNEIRDVLRDTEDAGAVYMGADWTMRGNQVTGNFIHRLGTPGRATTFLVGVYLDDQISGERIADNIVIGGDFGTVIGGGRDNAVTGNLFAYPRRAGAHIDARGTDKQRPRIGEFAAKLNAMPIASEPWRRRYPELAGLTADRYGVPGGNRLRDNILIRNPGPAVPMLSGPAAGKLGVTDAGNRVQTIATTAGREMAAIREMAGVDRSSRVLRVRVPDLQAKAGIR